MIFVSRREFAANDFILTNNGTIRLADRPAARVLIAETAISERILKGVVGWIVRLIEPRVSLSNSVFVLAALSLWNGDQIHSLIRG